MFNKIKKFFTGPSDEEFVLDIRNAFKDKHINIYGVDCQIVLNRLFTESELDSKLIYVLTDIGFNIINDDKRDQSVLMQILRTTCTTYPFYINKNLNKQLNKCFSHIDNSVKDFIHESLSFHDELDTYHDTIDT